MNRTLKFCTKMWSYILSLGVGFLMSTSLSSAQEASRSTSVEKPGVRCVLVVPPDVEPWPDANKRLDMVLRDVQWWYSCQMEGHGYGPKTFALETDAAGKVVVHIARLSEVPVTTGKVPSSVIEAAEKLVGTPVQRQGTLMVLVYNGYYAGDDEGDAVHATGKGLPGRWAHLTGWHYFSVNPEGWRIPTPANQLPEQNPIFPPEQVQALQASPKDGSRPVSQRTSSGHGVFIHEIGHALGLHHPTANDTQIAGDIMASEFWTTRGNFLPDLQNEWSCLSPADAARLDKHPLFQTHNIGTPSSGVSREMGKRGAVPWDAPSFRQKLAALDISGIGYEMAPLKWGERSQSNRPYIWAQGPPGLEGFLFTRLSGGKNAVLTARTLTAGRLLITTGTMSAPELALQNWQMLPTTLTYASPDGRQRYETYLYWKDVGANETIRIPQIGWTGTMLLGLAR